MKKKVQGTLGHGLRPASFGCKPQKDHPVQKYDNNNNNNDNDNDNNNNNNDNNNNNNNMLIIII